jgi:DNA recombination protein RmuC
MTELIATASLVLLIATVICLLILLRKASRPGFEALSVRLDAFERAQEGIERAVREETGKSREEMNNGAREQRVELGQIVKNFGESVGQRMMELGNSQKTQLQIFSDQLNSFAKSSAERLDAIRGESARGAKQLREEVVTTLKSISETMATTLKDLAEAQKAQLETMTSEIGKLSESTERKLEAVRVGVEGKLQSIQVENANQLELMRQTVDEKLQGTLEKRLGDSFKQVSERLEQVHKGFGEMQALATGVGDLKKVLANVKARGTWAEVQLGQMLEQILNPDQFAVNVATKESGERVEFAIRLPGQGESDEPVWLPIDAKFPIEDYQRLLEAQDRGNVEEVEAASKQIEQRVKACAKDICAKYLNPPKTTDFAIMFLPIEGLFAEVIRRNGLCDYIQRECRVLIAGPTTLWSILNSLQMGFRTLAIQKRSSEVWNLLAGVKTEWMQYGKLLELVQKRINQASETIDKVKVRSRAIGRKLKDVQELPAGEATAALLESTIDEPGEENDDMAPNRLELPSTEAALT